MVCLGNMCVDTLHKGDNDDEDDDDNNNNKTAILGTAHVLGRVLIQITLNVP